MVASMTCSNDVLARSRVVGCGEQMLNRDPIGWQGASQIGIVGKLHRLTAVEAQPLLLEV